MTLTEAGYRARIVDGQISRFLSIAGAVCIEGPKYSGKTWTALNHANSVVYIADPSGGFRNREMASMDPKLILDGEPPRLIDEWQDVPGIWGAVRFTVDRPGMHGRYILSGSSTPRREGIFHSGAGRIVSVRMRTMSLYESGDSTGSVSLRDLFDGKFEPRQTGDVDLRHLIHLVVRGGWPGYLDQSDSDAQLMCREYLRSLRAEDMKRVDGKDRNPDKVEALIRSLSRNVCTVVSNATLARDIKAFEDETLSDDTVADYIGILKRMFFLEDQPAFKPGLRSSVNVGKSPKRHLADPSLAAAALGATPDKLFDDLNTFGFLFESMCDRDLAVYAQSLGGELKHYRDAKGREIDAVVDLPDGRWGAFEVKLGANQIDDAAENLISVSRAFDGSSRGGPSVLCVICGMASYAYRREDGVYVVPITALKD